MLTDVYEMLLCALLESAIVFGSCQAVVVVVVFVVVVVVASLHGKHARSKASSSFRERGNRS